MTATERDEDDEAGLMLSQCPACGTFQKDLDGFGVMKCESCDFCRHPSETKIAGLWTCDLCGRARAK